MKRRKQYLAFHIKVIFTQTLNHEHDEEEGESLYLM